MHLKAVFFYLLFYWDSLVFNHYHITASSHWEMEINTFWLDNWSEWAPGDWIADIRQKAINTTAARGWCFPGREEETDAIAIVLRFESKEQFLKILLKKNISLKLLCIWHLLALLLFFIIKTHCRLLHALPSSGVRSGA